MDPRSLSQRQLKILQRARDNVHLWDAETDLGVTLRDVQALVGGQLIAPVRTMQFRVTEWGERVLDELGY